MKTDKELLELAAKAAGISVLDHEYDDALGFTYRLSQCQEAIDSFNPLIDDGDALRLAVKLNISIDISETWLNMFYNNKVLIATPVIVTEKGEATRRAIVRAAAAIGGEL